MKRAPGVPCSPARADQPYEIRSRAQVRALASPARQEIVDALVAAGACSIADLASHTGRAPDSLYFHVKHLQRVGLVIEREQRSTGKRPAAVYDVPGRPLRLSYAAAQGMRDLSAVVAAALRLAERDFTRALRLGVAVVEGPRRNVWGGRAKGWVNAEDLEEINRLVVRLQQILHEGRPGEGRTPLSLTFAFAPVRPSRRTPRPRVAVPQEDTLTERNGEP